MPTKTETSKILTGMYGKSHTGTWTLSDGIPEESMDDLACRYRRKLMLIKDQDGNERIAAHGDFQDTTITLTPKEWQEMCSLLEYRKQTKPCVFAKENRTIYAKLKRNPPVLKPGLFEVTEEDAE